MRSKFKIARVERVIDDNLVIEVSCGSEFKAKAYPIFTLDEIQPEDEVLLISVGESVEMYFYMLLRLDSTFYHRYKNMVLGFEDDAIVAKGKVNLVGEINLKGDINITPDNNGGSITVKGARPVIVDSKPGIFCSIAVCPYTGQPHTTDKIILEDE